MHPEQLQQAPSAEQYDKQLSEKLSRLSNTLKEHLSAEIDVYRSSATDYRMRAEFRVWHDGDDLNYVMFPKGEPKSPVVITNYLPGSTLMQALMPKVIAAVRNNTELRQRLFQIDFLTTTSDQCLLSLLYHRKLGDEWLKEAHLLEQQLDLAVIGRSRKQKIVCSTDHVLETIEVGERTLHYKQYENSFTQPNAGINQKMLTWATQQTQGCKGDLLELYCGNGNFSIALAANFNRVLATEVDKFGIKAAQYNIEKNNTNNIKVVRMSAAEVASALSGERAYRRLAHIELEDFEFDTVLVDPPRAGLDEQALKFVKGFNRILYVSCNPVTLEQNLRYLSTSHQVVSAALFDQFPFSEHIETGVVMQRR